jgi:hypothetical protein
MNLKGVICLSKNGLSLWQVILALALMTWSGCAYAPNLIPDGVPDEIDLRIIRSVAGAMEYPVVVSVTPKQDVVKIYWKTRGAWIPWQWPFTTADEWRFVLTAPDTIEPLCETKWFDATGNNQTEVSCQVKVRNYMAMPLIGEVDYRLNKDPDPNAKYRIHHRIYYFIEKR